MLLEDFDFDLPEELIAQHPAEKRDSSRMLLLSKSTGEIAESSFVALPEMLEKGDLLILNDTRVIPARLFGVKESGGKAEFLLLKKLDSADNCWLTMIKSSKPPKPGMKIFLSDGCEVLILERSGDDSWKVEFTVSENFEGWLSKNGTIPLPPYIRRVPDNEDRERYQTVFARTPGAAAAPTAGLHFTKSLLDKVRERGVDIRTVTLHVGPGTFQPVRVSSLSDHKMHSEHYEITAETAVAIENCRAKGKRVVAAGTTVVRALESAADEFGKVKAGGDDTSIFILPGFRFRVVDAMITNFHLPKSTLLMLVSAFAGKDNIVRAYRHAVENRFRFFSYGDAMFIS